ncbi:terpene synthase family protein [Streptomyces sp. IBSNAI002]|uniref:terpene synthase family protein n=1 Tax=Streptomyces sp. IBSNAI002 TaxID=3457500 RepID=UPI003FD3B45E
MSGRPHPEHGPRSMPMPMPTAWHLFPHRINPLAQAADDHTRAWIHHYRLTEDPAARERLVRTCMGIGAAGSFPDAGRDLLELVTDLFIWLTAVDDVHVEGPDGGIARLTEQITVFMRVLDGGGPTTGTGCVPALADLVRRTHATLTPGQRARLTAALHSAFLGWIWDMSLHDRPVGLAEYNTMRPHTVSAVIATTLIEPGIGIDLPDSVRESPGIRQLTRSTTLLTGWANDLYSFAYEHGTEADADAPRSLPTVLAHEYGLALPDAFAAAAAMWDEEAVRMHRRVTRLRSSSAPGVAAYATACAEYLAGSKAFYDTTRRYTAPHRPHGDHP